MLKLCLIHNVSACKTIYIFFLIPAIVEYYVLSVNALKNMRTRAKRSAKIWDTRDGGWRGWTEDAQLPSATAAGTMAIENRK